MIKKKSSYCPILLKVKYGLLNISIYWLIQGVLINFYFYFLINVHFIYIFDIFYLLKTFNSLQIGLRQHTVLDAATEISLKEFKIHQFYQFVKYYHLRVSIFLIFPNNLAAYQKDIKLKKLQSF